MTEFNDTAVDDVRRVREKIAQEHAGDLARHVEETRRIAASLRQSLGVKTAPSTPPHPRRSAAGG